MRKILIIVLIVLIVLLGGVWAYLLINGAPKSVAELGNDLFGGNGNVVTAPIPAPSIPNDIPADENRRVATDMPLVQVSDRAVAGAVIAQIASSTLIRYMEKGTGHIFEVDLETGAEIRVSNTTIPGAINAIWAPSGNRLIVETDASGGKGDTFLGTLSSSASSTIFDTERLEGQIANAAFGTSGDVLFYTADVSGNVGGFVRDTRSGETRQLFTTPFRDVSVLWDIWNGDAHYAFTRPAVGFTGYLYQIRGESLVKIDEGDTLTAARPQDGILLTSKDSGQGASTLLINTESGAGSFLQLRAVKEKCAGKTLWCGASTEAAYGFPVSWYQGMVSYEDTLYRINAEGEVTATIELTDAAREPIDIIGLMAGDDGRVIFRNKRDSTLWLMNPAL